MVQEKENYLQNISLTKKEGLKGQHEEFLAMKQIVGPYDTSYKYFKVE